MSSKRTTTDSFLPSLVTNNKFWVFVTGTAAVALIVWDWYSDRYATPIERYNRIKNDYIISVKDLRKIRTEFFEEMNSGLLKNPKSSLKMLHSNIKNVPNGNESGVYYALDWGGTNYRVLRIEFYGSKKKAPKITESRTEISQEYQHCKSAEILFDYLSNNLKSYMHEFKEDIMEDESKQKQKKIPIGFTFSFPINQPDMNSGILIEWTKGFDIPGVVGKNITDLMHSAFAKNSIPAEIKAVCNDTVGTLLACAFEHSNVRIGLILGTGTNASYIEPELENEIINIEWGAYNKNLPRMPTDFLMDEYTPNPGLQYAEKLISGMYLGEVSRLLLIEVFRENVTKYGEQTLLNKAWQFESKQCSEILDYYYKNNSDGILNICKNKLGLLEFDNSDAIILAQCIELIFNRSADIAVSLLLGVLEKTGLFTTHRKDKRNPFEEDQFVINSPYNNNKEDGYVTVGIDGSVFQKVPRYKERMLETIQNMVGYEIATKIKLVRSEDGSGKGAALAVAANAK